jgi:hypothetical protein
MSSQRAGSSSALVVVVGPEVSRFKRTIKKKFFLSLSRHGFNKSKTNHSVLSGIHKWWWRRQGIQKEKTILQYFFLFGFVVVFGLGMNGMGSIFFFFFSFLLLPFVVSCLASGRQGMIKALV